VNTFIFNGYANLQVNGIFLSNVKSYFKYSSQNVWSHFIFYKKWIILWKFFFPGREGNIFIICFNEYLFAYSHVL